MHHREEFWGSKRFHRDVVHENPTLYAEERLGPDEKLGGGVSSDETARRGVSPDEKAQVA